MKLLCKPVLKFYPQYFPALLQVPKGQRTDACLRNNVSVGVQYLEAWLGGMGCVPLYNLMEDAATAEIGRTQVWQWIHHKATLDNKDVLTVSRFNQVGTAEAGVVVAPYYVSSRFHAMAT